MIKSHGQSKPRPLTAGHYTLRQRNYRDDPAARPQGIPKGRGKTGKTVLVGVIKDRRDLGALLTQKWYRIPVKHAPQRKFNYLAFYQPAWFGRRGKRIRYYARVLSQRTIRRKDLLPDELEHPRADDYYFLFRVDNIKKLPRPIRNVTPRRISFGFTTLERLLKSRNILELYDVVPTEEILGGVLKRAGLEARAQYRVVIGKKQFRPDFALFCKRGAIAVECDNLKAHSGLRRRRQDRDKDLFLRRHGWCVIRLTEHTIVSDVRSCIARVRRAIRKFGGLSTVDLPAEALALPKLSAKRRSAQAGKFLGYRQRQK